MRSLFNWLSQVVSITQVSLQTILERKGSSAAAIFGIAGVVGVFVGVLSMAVGFRHAMTVGGDPSTAIVMRSGSDSEMMSILALADTRIIADAPGIARRATSNVRREPPTTERSSSASPPSGS